MDQEDLEMEINREDIFEALEMWMICGFIIARVVLESNVDLMAEVDSYWNS